MTGCCYARSRSTTGRRAIRSSGCSRYSADERLLAGLAATLEILAHQVALAVERIILREEVIRQGNQAYFRTLVHDTSDVILIVDDDGKVRYATPSATSIFGDIPVAGAYLWDLVADGRRDELVGRPHAEHGRRRLELPLRGPADQPPRRHGRPGPGPGQRSARRAERGRPGVDVRDVTAQHQLEEQLKYQAFHDALTGLPNRLFFQDRIAQQVAAARRNTRSPACCSWTWTTSRS